MVGIRRIANEDFWEGPPGPRRVANSSLVRNLGIAIAGRGVVSYIGLPLTFFSSKEEEIHGTPIYETTPRPPGERQVPAPTGFRRIHRIATAPPKNPPRLARRNPTLPVIEPDELLREPSSPRRPGDDPRFPPVRSRRPD